jgi:hypothetical protein
MLARSCPVETTVAVALLRHMLAEDEAGWNMGTFGAIAEFHHVENDPAPLVNSTNAGGEVVTARGGIRVEVAADVLPVAYEGLSRRPRAWTHALSFCLPVDVSAMGKRPVLTELGPDRDALRDADRSAVLFDMGLGAPHIDFCLRTAAAALIDVLRRAAGQSLLATGSHAMPAIIEASPHRVCVSRLGRIEVYQPIPLPAAGARSPIGPHTHVLPDLLKLGRSHSANSPIPGGWVSALNLHPASPIFDRLGNPKPFDASGHAEFQALLRAYGPPGFIVEKDRIVGAVLAGGNPRSYPVAPTRIGRTAARVALRQMLHTHAGVSSLSDWLSAFDHGAETVDADA